MLNEIALKYGTDKSTVKHGYTLFYDMHLKHLTKEHIKLCEIGVAYGSSLKMWREYFRNGEIFGVDNFGSFFDPKDKSEIVESLEKRDITVLDGCQTDESVYPDVDWDIFIDDGSHLQEHQQRTLSFMLPKMKPGSYYFIEDLHSRKNHKSIYPRTLKVCKRFMKTGVWISPVNNTKQIVKTIKSMEIYEDKLVLIKT